MELQGAQELIIAGVTTATYFTGRVIDHRAVKGAEEAKKPLVEEWGFDPTEEASGESPQQLADAWGFDPTIGTKQTISTKPEEVKEDKDINSSLRQRVGRRISRYTRPLPVAAALAGLLTTAAVVSAELSTPEKPFIGIAVDHSGATNFAIDGPKPVLSEVNLANNAFIGLGGKYQVESYVGAFGDVNTMDVSSVNGGIASGDASMPKAVKEALDQANILKPSGNGKNAAVVVITNGNTIGDTNQVISEAKADGKTTPVDIANVESSASTSQATIASFNQIATATKGHYYPAEGLSPSAIRGKVESSLTPAKQAESFLNPDEGIFIVGAIASIVVAGRLFKNRKKGLLERDIKGNRR